MRWIVILLFLPAIVKAQLGGTSTYDFLEVPTSARAAALGGNFLSVNDSDLNVIAANPSLLDKRMHNHISLSYVGLPPDIGFGYFAYARNFGKAGTFAAGLHFVNYGNFSERDIYDQEIGSFSAGEYALNFSYGWKLHPLFRVGGTLKFIYSSLYKYNSFGMGVDIAATYVSKNKYTLATLVAKNLGGQFVTYNNGNNEPLPTRVQIGFSQGFNKAPFRLMAMVDHLQQWNLRSSNYDVSQLPKLPNGEIDSVGIFFDNLARHLVFGIEFIPANFIKFAVSYNYLRGQQMKVNESIGIAGLSFGIALRVRNIEISYGRSTYHFAGASDHLTVKVDINGFRKKITRAPKTDT